MLSIPTFRNTLTSSPSTKFTLITQNVDELSRRALHTVYDRHHHQISSSSPTYTYTPNPPPTEFLEIHRSLFDLLCTECQHVEKNYESPICPALKGTEEIFEGRSQVPEPDIPLDELPHCSSCGALARPGVVWFEEAVPGVDLMNSIAREADLCLVVGTSSIVRNSQITEICFIFWEFMP